MMKIFLILLHLILANCDQWELNWQDNFDSQIDKQNWSYDIGDGCSDLCSWGNNEEEYYTNSSSNSYVKDGKLVIEAKKEDMHNKKYSSAKLLTKGKVQFRYGKFEISAKFPEGSGIWSSIWMMPVNNVLGRWPRSGKIDIVQILGEDPSLAHCTANYGEADDELGGVVGYYRLQQGTFADDFHLFEIIWNNDGIKWFIDGNKVADLSIEYATPFTYPFNSDDFYLIFNIAVDSPEDDTLFPVKMEVDYVRVYRLINNK